jgi:flagellar hook-associated protein 3 FlgL
MRIADNMMFDQVRNNVSKNRSESADLQNQAATQKRVTKPSDDPIGASRVLSARVDLQGHKQYSKTLEFARSFLEFTDQSLGELSDHLMRVKELTLSQANDASANEQTRRVVAEEISQIYKQVVNIGNRKLGERHIFGGFKTTTNPFDFTGKYHGDDGEMLVSVDKQSYVSMNMPGSQIFMGEGLSGGGLSRPEAAPTPTLEELQKQLHAKGQEKQAPVEAPLVTMRAPASESGPAEEIPVSTEGSGTNVFDVLRKLEVSLRSNDKLGVQDSLDQVDEALSQVVLARSRVGSRVSVLGSAMDTLEKQKVDANMTISQLEDADVFKVASDMNKNQSTLQATLQTSGKLMSQSLMDFIR